MTKKRVEYSESFKAEAITKVKENDDNVSLTAKELGIPMQTLAKWQKKVYSVFDNRGHYTPPDMNIVKPSLKSC
jgi:hypothetical protein